MTVKQIVEIADGTNDIYLEYAGKREKLDTYEESLALAAYGDFVVSHITATQEGNLELSIKTIPARA